MSTAFHLQTDGQTEYINQTIETFLRSFINLQQTGWVELLPLGEFAYNNSTTSPKGMTPFYANYNYHLFSITTSTVPNIFSASSVSYGYWMKAVIENYKIVLEKSSEEMKTYADQSCIEPLTFEQGNLVMQNRKNIKIHCRARKLDQTMDRRFKILDIISPLAVHFRVPKM
jgi:hypothetical protein